MMFTYSKYINGVEIPTISLNPDHDKSHRHIGLTHHHRGYFKG